MLVVKKVICGIMAKILWDEFSRPVLSGILERDYKIVFYLHFIVRNIFFYSLKLSQTKIVLQTGNMMSFFTQKCITSNGALQ